MEVNSDIVLNNKSSQLKGQVCQLKSQISELENCYAELFIGDSDKALLKKIHVELTLLKAELRVNEANRQ